MHCNKFQTVQLLEPAILLRLQVHINRHKALLYSKLRACWIIQQHPNTLFWWCNCNNIPATHCSQVCRDVGLGRHWTSLNSLFSFFSKLLSLFMCTISYNRANSQETHKKLRKSLTGFVLILFSERTITVTFLSNCSCHHVAALAAQQNLSALTSCA